MLVRIFLFSLFFSAAASAAELFSEPQLRTLSQSHAWKTLLHYRGSQSEADGPGFFISPLGKKYLHAELLADLAAFADPQAARIGPLKQHPQCAFPERYKFLKTSLNLQIADQPCKEFLEWKRHFRVRSVVVVYAAAYMGSPASMFGHTFLRFDFEPRLGQIQKNDLLDYAISFEAAVEPNPGPEYVIKGLLGLYPGYFTMAPYFLKTNNYTSMESRDLWEYQLNLTPEQIDRLINHVWETGTTYFNYYFFDRNCSYHLLSLLEVANHDWDLRSHFHAYAIPIDTVRTLTETSGAVRSVEVRPSILRILGSRLSQMTPTEQDRFYFLKNKPSEANETDSAKTLDALMDWQKFEAVSQTENVDLAPVRIDRNLLLLRAKKDEPETLVMEKLISPDQGHRSAKISVFAGAEGRDNFVGFEARPSFHDLLSPNLGYLPQSELVMASLRVSSIVSEKKATRIDELTFASVANLEPLSRLQKHLSWAVSGGFKRPIDLDCTDCLAGNFQGGIGATLELQKVNWTLLLMGHAESSWAFKETMGQSYRAAPGLQLSFLLPVGDHWKVSASGESLRYFAGNEQSDLTKSDVNVNYFWNSTEIKAQWSAYRTTRRNIDVGTLNVGWYF